MLKAYSQCDGIWRWDLQEVMRSWGWGPIMRLVTFQEEEETQWDTRVAWWDGSRLQARPPPTTKTWSCTSQPPEQWEINVYCLNHQSMAFCDTGPSRLRHSTNILKCLSVVVMGKGHRGESAGVQWRLKREQINKAKKKLPIGQWWMYTMN